MGTAPYLIAGSLIDLRSMFDPCFDPLPASGASVRQHHALNQHSVPLQRNQHQAG